MEKANNKRKWWGRRVAVSIGWCVVNLGLIIIQPYCGLSEKLVSSFLDKSAWIIGLLIVGLSGVNAVYAYVNGKKKP